MLSLSTEVGTDGGATAARPGATVGQQSEEISQGPEKGKKARSQCLGEGRAGLGRGMAHARAWWEGKLGE